MQWVEKYRPNKLNEITTQNNIIDSLSNAIYSKNIPHLIFYGSSGVGKTSTILALAKELFGSYWKERIIELNASDERGINVVRDKIKTYAKQSIKENINIPPWKIIILDEADTMTNDSQFALRRIMEEYSNITRFCIICNYHNKIIDPLISRCSLFYFKPINDNDVFNKLKYICSCENFNCSDYLINKIIKISNGDLRKAINFLQKCYNTFGNILNQDILNEISGVIAKDTFVSLIEAIKLKDSFSIDTLINDIVNNGYSLVNQILHFDTFIKGEDTFTSRIKSLLSIKLTEIDNNLLKGGDEYIEFMRLAYDFSKIINSN
jgi:replication factor C subunit 2/4